MNRVLFAHGKPPKERYDNPELPKPDKSNWFPWAKTQLELRGILADVPQLPRPYHPDYGNWKGSFPYSEIDKETALVGFSAGAEFLLRLLSEEDYIYAERLVLVAPWCDKDRKYGDFSDFEIAETIADRVGKITIMSSIDDSQRIQERSGSVFDALPNARHIQLDGYGHFLIGNNMTSQEFPELIAELVE